MDYEFWFWILVSYLAGRATVRPLFYFGRDQKKYDAAWIAIMPK